MVQVLLHNSTLTPAPAAYGAAVEKALAAAERDARRGRRGQSLAGPAVLVVTVDPDDDIAVIDLERFDDAVLDLVFDLAEATASFVVIAGADLRDPGDRSTAAGLVGPWDFQAHGTAERADFRDWLAGDIETSCRRKPARSAVAAALAKARADATPSPPNPYSNA
jgi:hypothetical protein